MSLVHYRFGMTGQALTVRFAMEATTGNVFYTGAAPVAGDVKIGLDGTAPANTTNLPTHNGNGVWSLVITAAEMQARFANVVIQNGAAGWTPTNILIMTEMRVGQVQLDLSASSLDANGAALVVQGLGTSAGINSTGGATGQGAKFVGGSSSGAGVQIVGTAGNAIGLDIDGQGSAAGVDVTGGATGHGINASGGATSGCGIRGAAQNGTGVAAVGILGYAAAGTGSGIGAVADATDRHGLAVQGNGAGHGMQCTPGATGNGIHAQGGSSSGAAIKADGTAGNAAGIIANGQGSAAGLEATGGATGNGATLTGGATSGHGLVGTNQAGNSSGIVGAGRGTGVGLSTTHATDNSLMTNLFDTLEGTEPSGAISSNATFKQIWQYLKRRFTNKVTQTNTARTWYKDDSATSLGTQACANDGVTESQNKMT